MFIAFVVFLVIFSIFLHELGHALYMQKYGVKIDKFSIGLPFPIALKFRSKKIFDGALLQLTPFLLGAFVLPTKEGMNKMNSLPYGKQADIYGAGPLANFLFFGVLALICYAVNIEVRFFPKFWFDRPIVLAGMIVILFVGREIFSRYLLVPCGLWFAYDVASNLFAAPTETVAGPVGIGQIIGKIAVGMPEAIFLGLVLSLSIGLFNIFPIMPLDGGRTASALINKFFGRNLQVLYIQLSSIVFISLIILVFYSDIVNLMRP